MNKNLQNLLDEATFITENKFTRYSDIDERCNKLINLFVKQCENLAKISIATEPIEFVKEIKKHFGIKD